MSFYIAYGSNLNKEQMRYRCPTAKVVGNGYIEDYELTFRLYATIEKAKGKKVPVTVWEIDEVCESSLDRYEGYPRLYRKEIVPVNVSGKTYDAMVYIMNKDARPYHIPLESYYKVVLQGYVDMKLEIEYLDKGILRTEEIIQGGFRRLLDQEK